MAGIAARLLAHEQERISNVAKAAATEQLESVAEQVALSVEVVQGELMRTLQSFPNDALEKSLQYWEEKSPLVRNVFIWQGLDDLILPNKKFPLTQEQQSFLQRYRTLFSENLSNKTAPPPEVPSQSSSKKLYKRAQMKSSNLPPSTWLPWYWENHLGLIGWTQQEPEGPYYGVEIEMIAMLAEMHTVLPTDLPPDQHVALLNGHSEVIFQSGDFDPPPTLSPALRVPIGHMLPHWEIVLYTPSGTFNPPRSYAFFSGILVTLLFIVLFTASALLLREIRRNRIEARQKTTFVSNVSHELKTPLTTIRMYADLLGEGRVVDPQKAKQYLHTIVGESERLTRLVNNMLDFSRLEQGRKKYRITTCDLRELLEETVQTQRIRLQKANMELTLELPKSPSLIQTDCDAIQQVLLNLIDNAIKYAASGGLLSIQLTAAPDGYFIAISDAGSGISKKHRRHIFKRFYRIDDSIISRNQGCGLGLSIAQHLLADLNATLEYQPAPIGGACFIITLPTQPPAS